MNILDILRAALLGIIEGLLEFIPVSSTGHLILAKTLMGLDSAAFGPSFVILIQLGAIMALLFVYTTRLLRIFMAVPHDPAARHFVAGLLIAFLPAVAVGLVAGPWIKTLLFSPYVVCVTLVIGGFILLWADRRSRFVAAPYTNMATFPLWMYLKIGLFQCIAMIPGVSRSGATIVGAMLVGADKRSAAEFSFFLALPTMIGAFGYEVYKSAPTMAADTATLIAIGFAAAFVSALFCVRVLLDYISVHGYAVFAYWRIAVGTLGMGLLLLTQ
ncbi:MAG: undecaprenyl-diphosphate phosphatase [Pseudomonadota bacterium]